MWNFLSGLFGGRKRGAASPRAAAADEPSPELVRMDELE